MYVWCIILIVYVLHFLADKTIRCHLGKVWGVQQQKHHHVWWSQTKFSYESTKRSEGKHVCTSWLVPFYYERTLLGNADLDLSSVAVSQLQNICIFTWGIHTLCTIHLFECRETKLCILVPLDWVLWVYSLAKVIVFVLGQHKDLSQCSLISIAKVYCTALWGQANEMLETG